MSASGPQDEQRGNTGADANRSRSSNRYIVRMAELPVSSYDGSVPSLPATRPQRGQKIDRDAAAVVGYAGYLDNRHDDVLKRVGGGRKLYDYRYSFNGFTAELTDAQADALKSTGDVLSVTKDELQHADTSFTPTFLGLDAKDGLWDRLGGPDDAGDDVIIGMIDSGVWPESRSFSDRASEHDDRDDDNDDDHRGRDAWRRGHDWGDGPFAFDHHSKWKGTCETGEAFRKSDCNRKLIGARRFNEAWGGDAGVKAERPWEYASPRDYNGHGTHTASTAGGNKGVKASGPARVFGRVSGIAPRARIAVYKALWSTEDGTIASGFTSDLVAAIDQAVADGVDVINYSISGTTANFLDAAEIAFLFAADAGVFVSASAGNSGPTTGTVAHPSPWITTVAAGTHSRTGTGSVTLGNGVTMAGPSFATAVKSSLIDAAAAGLPRANPTALSLCFTAADNGGTPVLDPAKVAGKIVLCDRGTNARVNKSRAVRDAGGVGMILVNVVPGTVNADLHYVPTVHLPDTARASLKVYAAGVEPTAAISRTTITFDVPAPLTAAFSSRGPLVAGGGDLLKPDVIAPGQDIVAAVAPPANAGLQFNMYNGTSMSAPHVAGLAALLKDLHEDWSPMMIKSALMTTGTDVADGGVPAPNTNPTLIFRQGAGHVSPNAAADPGLAFDSDINDWFAFLCGATVGVNPAICSGLAGAGYSLDPSDLNMASIAIGNLAGTQTVTRTVTNVGRWNATYTPTVTGMLGFDVVVSPSTLTLRPGRSKTFTVTFTRQTAAVSTYTGGQLTWHDGWHTVRVPMVVRPVALAAPIQVSGTGGPIGFNVTFGFTGPFSATPRGLIPASTTPGEVADDPHDAFVPGGPGVTAVPVAIAPGTTYARFSLFDANVSPASDIDLYVALDGVLVGGSGGGTSQEEVNLVNPAPGNYIVYVHGFSVPGTASFTLFSWLLGSTSAGNMTVAAPPTATTGGTGTIGLTFTGLTAGQKYLGSVAYGGSPGLPNPTIVRVDP
jgi:hypothetical protein